MEVASGCRPRVSRRISSASEQRLCGDEVALAQQQHAESPIS